MRTLIPFACATWLVVLCPSWAGEQERRFLEFPSGRDTTTFDLSTVQVIQPGRFSVIRTTIDNPDVIELELKAFNTLRTYCARPAGEYPAPADLLTLGPADRPVKSVEVRGAQTRTTRKIITWEYPYTRLRNGIFLLGCGRQDQLDKQRLITNGIQTRELFDCRRGLAGTFLDAIDNGNPSNVLTAPVRPNTYLETYYLGVCYAVMHERPYLPGRPASK